MDLFEEFATNEKLEIEGREVPYGKFTFVIARSGNKHFGRLFTRLYNKNKMVLESKGEAAEQKSDEIMIEVMSKTILVGWKDTVTYQGEQLAFSEANAKRLLAHKDFRRWVSTQAEDFDAYKLKQESSDEKN